MRLFNDKQGSMRDFIRIRLIRSVCFPFPEGFPIILFNYPFPNRLLIPFLFPPPGDNSYKTAVLGPQRSFNQYNSARQPNSTEDNDHPQNGYLTEQDQNAQPSDYKCTSSASSVTNGYGSNSHRYNRDYPASGGRNFASSYRPRYAHTNGHRNSGASSTTSSTTSSSYQQQQHNPHATSENGWRPSRSLHYSSNSRPYNNYYGFNNNKENSGYSTSSHVSGNGECQFSQFEESVFH